MTDSVRCTTDSSNAFTCEVQLDSNFETLTCEAPEPEPAPPPPPPASNPAVSSLVSSFVSRTEVPAPPAPLITRAALAHCASDELGLVLATLAVKSPLVSGLVMLKASFDTSSCLTRAHNDAVELNAQAYCVAQGGTVTAVEGDKTICEVREKAK